MGFSFEIYNSKKKISLQKNIRLDCETLFTAYVKKNVDECPHCND